jgi:hypothetical protein
MTIKLGWTLHHQAAAAAAIVATPPPSSAATTATIDLGIDRLEYEAVPKNDRGAYQEYSVIFTNRSLNLMSEPFMRIMRDLNELLKRTYNAHKVAIIPG